MSSEITRIENRERFYFEEQENTIQIIFKKLKPTYLYLKIGEK